MNTILKSCFALMLFLCGSAFAAEKPHAVIVVGTRHYSPELSMPLFAEELERWGFRTTIVMGEGDPERKTGKVLPGIEALADADVAIFFMRFLTLGDEEWGAIEEYIVSGKPVVGLRTSTHSFKYPNSHPRFEWNDGFGRRVMGTPYLVHQSGSTDARIVENHTDHPILNGVVKSKFTSAGSLYLTRLEPGCVPLVTGTGTGKPRLLEKPFGPVMVDEFESDIIAWAWENEWGGKVFGTSFGHVSDFGEEAITRILVNSVCWAAGSPLPPVDAKIATWEIADPRKRAPKSQAAPK